MNAADATRRPRVAHLITDLDIGGAEQSLLKMIASTGSQLEHAVVCLTHAGPIAPAIEALGVPVTAAGMRRGRPSPGGALRVARALRAWRADVLQTWLYHADLLGTLLRPAVRGPVLAWNIRCVDMDLQRYAPSTRAVRGTLARLSRVPAAVVTNSEASRVAHEALGYRPKRWVTIPNGFDTDRFKPDPELRAVCRQELGVGDDSVLVGMVARNDPAKDHETLLEALDSVAASERSVRGLLLGEGVTLLEEAVRRRGLAGRVILRQSVPDTAPYFAALDVAVLSSAFGESFPNVIGEAMATGLPCVATDVGDVRDILGDGGIVVPRRDAAELAAAVVRLVRAGQTARRDMGKAGRERVTANFGLHTSASRYVGLYRELVEGRCAAEASGPKET